MQKPVIFLAFANDLEDPSQFLRNLNEETHSIRAALKEAVSSNLCELVVRTNASINDIFDVFQDDKYQNRIAVFHYGGHASSYHLLLQSEDNETVLAHKEGLVRFLGRQDSLKLVFLNGCSTEQHGKGLLESGVPAVISTSESVSDKVATRLADAFYKGFGQGNRLEQSWQEAEDRIITEFGEDGNVIYRRLYHREDPESRFPWRLEFRKGAEIVKDFNLREAADQPLFGIPDIPEHYDLPPKPFRYLNRFTKKEAGVFFGRDSEIRTVYDYVNDSAVAPILLLFGQSGVGKSSLLEAGVHPRLEESKNIVYLRHNPERHIIEQLSSALKIKDGQSFNEAWKNCEKEKPLIIVFDQIEEIYIKPNPDTPDEPALLTAFLNGVFDDSKNRPQGKMILSFRKEYLPEITKMLNESELPFQNIFIEKLNKKSIIQAVNGLTRHPALKKKYNLTIEDELPEMIADDLVVDSASSIAPVLQILLTKMWEAALAEDMFAPKFTQKLYLGLKNEGILMSDFLLQKLRQMEDWNKEVMESGLALDLLYHHTTKLGTASQSSLETLEKRYPHRKNILEELVRESKNSYLLSETPAKGKGEKPGLTLAHDTLAPIVREKFERSDKPGPKARRILRTKIHDWINTRSVKLLTWAEIKNIYRGRKGMRMLSDDEKMMVEECRKYVQNLRRWRRFLAGALLISVVIGGWLWYSNQQKKLENESSRYITEGQRISESDPTEGIKVMAKGLKMRPDDPLKRNLVYEVYRNNVFYKNLEIPFDGDLVNVAFSTDENWIALTNNLNSNVYLFDKNGDKIENNALELPGNTVSELIFSADNQYVMAGSTDRNAYIWTTSGTLHRQFLMPNDFSSVTAVALSKDNQKAATGYSENGVYIWDVGTENQLDSIPVFEYITSLSFLNNNEDLIIGTENGTVFFHDFDLRQTDTLSVGNSPLRSVDICPNKDLALTAFDSEKLLIWEKIGSVWGRKDSLISEFGNFSVAKFSPDGKMILNGTSEGIGQVWNVENGALLRNLKKHDGVLKSVEMSQDGKSVFTAAEDNQLKLWDFPYDLPFFEIQTGNRRVRALEMPEDGTKLVSGVQSDGIFVINPNDGTILSHYAEIKRRPTAISVLPNQNIILSAYQREPYVHVWDSRKETGEIIDTVNFFGKPEITNIEHSPDGKNIFIAAKKGMVAFAKFDGKLTDTLTLKAHKKDVRSVAFSPNGQKAVSVSLDSTAIIWNLNSREKEVQFQLPGTGLDVAFLNDESVLIGGSSDSLLIYNVSGKFEKVFARPFEKVYQIEVLADKKVLITTENQKIMFYDSEGYLIREYQMPVNLNSPPRPIAVDSNGEFIYHGSLKGKVFVFRNDRGELDLFLEQE